MVWWPGFCRVVFNEKNIQSNGFPNNQNTHTKIVKFHSVSTTGEQMGVCCRDLSKGQGIPSESLPKALRFGGNMKTPL